VRVVIISHNQAALLSEMVYSLRAQLSFPRLFVLDRCTDGSSDLLDSLGEEYIIKDDGDGWEAGRVRNVGLSHVGYTSPVLMLDGDRVPSGLSDSLLEEASRKYDITLLGVSRDHRKFFKDFDFSPNDKWGSCKNGVYTAGFLISSSALNTITAYNGGFLFNPCFDGLWGYEDMSLGDVGAHLGLTCGTFPRYAWVRGTFDTQVTKDHDATQHGKREILASKMRSEGKSGSLLRWG